MTGSGVLVVRGSLVMMVVVIAGVVAVMEGSARTADQASPSSPVKELPIYDCAVGHVWRRP